MQHLKVGFIGAGNMAQAIIGGLIASGHNPENLWASSRTEEKLTKLGQSLGIKTTTNNPTLVEHCDIVVLSVKPVQMQPVCNEIQSIIQMKNPLVISVAAGITTDKLTDWLHTTAKCVRCMPNTPSLIKQGASGLFANAHVDENSKNDAENLMQAVGIVEWVKEERLIDAVTAVSGCGPAYFFLMIEAMQSAAEKLGLTPDAAHRLTLQTALGAAQMVLQSEHSPKELRHRVTSKGGCTAEAIDVFETSQLQDIVLQAMQAADKRSLSLAKEMD